MSRSSYLFSGIFGAFAVSVVAMVLLPQRQLGALKSQVDEDSGVIYPLDNQRKGKAVYISEGCVYCHSQAVRDPQNGTDIERGWGSRRTIGLDYLFENGPLIGTHRLGPDLANVGAKDWRNESLEDKRKPSRRDAAWHLLHLYKPTAAVADSTMPPYRYLFKKAKVTGERSSDALPIDAGDGFQVVPTERAKELVAYLLSLDRSVPLKGGDQGATAPVAQK
jgi:cytochrome c oxidase cbb3-type subunit 2